MKALFLNLFLLFVLVFPVQANAQEITKETFCFWIINDSDHAVFGKVVTGKRPDNGERYSSAFRLQPSGTVREEDDVALDSTQVCTNGPFMKGRTLELSIVTIFPVYTCKTKVELGDVRISSTDNPDGSRDTIIHCNE